MDKSLLGAGAKVASRKLKFNGSIYTGLEGPLLPLRTEN